MIEVIINADGKSCTTVNPFGKSAKQGWWPNDGRHGTFEMYKRKWEQAQSERQTFEIENPVSVISTKIRKPDQIIQPWQFGHSETKTTCLWLKNVPLLKYSDVVDKGISRIHKKSALNGKGSSKDRQKNRSKTYPGIAKAMAEQWGNL